MPAPIKPEALPGILAEVARLTSVDVAIAIARKWGNRRMYLPHDPPAQHPLVQLLGRRTAGLICARLGGERVTWPSAKAFLRWYDARAMWAGGSSIPVIATKLDVNERWARRLVRGVEKGTEEQAPATTAPAWQNCPVCGHRHRSKTRHADAAQLRLFE